MRLYVGMDLHSTNCYTGILDENGQRSFSRKLPNDKAKVLSALVPYQSEIVGVVVESTYNWYWLVDALIEASYPVHLANPAAMKQYEGVKYLDDRQDAFWLANMLRLGILPEGYIYPKETRGVRDLLRQRSRFMTHKISLKHTLQNVYCNNTGITLSNNVINQLDVEEIVSTIRDEALLRQMSGILKTIRFLEEEIKTIETHVQSVVSGGLVYSALTTVPGIGPILGMTISLESGPIDRFPSASDYASYCRCVPSAYWSNEKKKGAGNKKNGNKYLSWAYAEAAHFAIRYCAEAKTYYQRKCAKTHLSSAYRAVANKLAKACYFIMKEQRAFDAF